MTDTDKKAIEKYKNLILDIPGIKSAEYVNSTTSSVTLSWGIEWSSDYIARDIIQNFRDSNRSEINSINVKTKNDQIVVSAKSTFDLRKLLFLGSNKAGDDENIGKFGEGLFVIVIGDNCIMRDLRGGAIGFRGENDSFDAKTRGGQCAHAP